MRRPVVSGSFAPSRYFNPRTPVGCDSPIVWTCRKTCYFNPRTPVGCDAPPKTTVGVPITISIHAPQWGATSRRRPTGRTGRNFNPRTPVGCDNMTSAALTSPKNFNPRTPVGCDPACRSTHRAVHGISIHAPQWGATLRLAECCVMVCISIHAPQWGATTADEVVALSKMLFQSTHPSGVRPFLFGGLPQRHEFQSTHPSGVRPCGLAPVTGARYFNPRTPVGCDVGPLATAPVRHQFQSTHPSGVRLLSIL